jgi:LacI family transcriptional regulator
MYGLSEEEIGSLQLPQNIALDNTVGILGIEMFDRAYIQFLCDFGIPAILADGYYGFQKSLIPCDVISMENYASVRAITQQIIDAGAKTLGFVGDIHHCNSFYERWGGFCSVLKSAGIELDKQVCILEKDGVQYSDLSWTEAQLRKMPYLPDAFVCANDFHALRVMLALKKMGISMPDDIMIAGFGDSAEASVIDTGLTTAEIPSNEMGIIAANVLLARISNKERPYGLTYIQTRPIFRGSTKSK